MRDNPATAREALEDEIDALEADLAATRDALRRYVEQHNLADRDRHCVCSYCNVARAALAEADA